LIASESFKLENFVGNARSDGLGFRFVESAKCDVWIWRSQHDWV